jgi:adenylate cyclase
VAARLESLSAPGGICISRSVYDQLRGKIDHPMTALGPQMVKNIPVPVEVWRVEIDGAAPVSVVSAEPSGIAVLPFDNMSSEPQQEFLADGIVKDVITELSRFRSLFVIARNSTFFCKGTAKDVRQIAEDLGVRYVVEGSVRRGDRIRLTA